MTKLRDKAVFLFARSQTLFKEQAWEAALQMLDALAMRWREVRYRKDPDRKSVV